MHWLYDLIDSLRTMSLVEASLWVTFFNLLMFVIAIAAGHVLVGLFARRRITPTPGPITRFELVLAALCVVLNGAVAVVGVILWREGVLTMRPYGEYGILTIALDAVILLVAMDLLMYLFHRAAHHPLVYSLAHSTHHRYNSPRPLSLFVLHPLEVIGFGGLWIIVITVYSSSIEGILVYLSFNLAFGLVGHLGVEPMPGGWVRLPAIGQLSTSTFHAEHHMDRETNYGFYLLVWDRLFGTLSRQYAGDFARATAGNQAPSVIP